jgi:hypothetical protein
MSACNISSADNVYPQLFSKPSFGADATKSPLKFIGRIFQKYTVVVGVPKKVYHLVKELFSLFRLTSKYKAVDFGFKGIGMGFILFGAPIHLYSTYTDFHKMFKAICKVDVFKFFEYGLRSVVDLANIGDDVSSIATLLSAFGLVSKTAVVWAGTLGSISGAFQSLALISAGIDFYRVNKFQNGFRDATKEGKSYEDLLQFMCENKKLTKKVMGMKTEELLKVLKAKEAIDDQADAAHLMKGKVSKKIWIARAALMKAQHKQVIKILTTKALVQVWTTRIALVAGVISVIAAGILILSPFLFPLVAPTIASVGTGFVLATTTLFVGKFFVEKVVDLKFKRDIYSNSKNEISPIIVANPVTKEDVENIYGEQISNTSPNGIYQPKPLEIDPIIDQIELQETIRRRVLLSEVF